MRKRDERKEKGEKTGKKEREKKREGQTDELMFKMWNIPT